MWMVGMFDRHVRLLGKVKHCFFALRVCLRLQKERESGFSVYASRLVRSWKGKTND